MFGNEKGKGLWSLLTWAKIRSSNPAWSEQILYMHHTDAFKHNAFKVLLHTNVWNKENSLQSKR